MYLVTKWGRIIRSLRVDSVIYININCYIYEIEKKFYLQTRNHVLKRRFGTLICCYEAVLAQDEISDSVTVVADDFETFEIRLDFEAPICLNSLNFVLPTFVHYPVQ